MCVEKKYAVEYVSASEALIHMKPGCAFACNRLGLFDHYGIYVGWIDGVPWVIHYSGKVLSKTCIRFESFLKIAGDSKVRIFGCHESKSPIKLLAREPCDPVKVLRRALERLGETEYNVATWNCESFVNWVFYHVGFSSQSFKAAPCAAILAGYAVTNPVTTFVGASAAKSFLDAKVRAHSDRFKKKQEDLKQKLTYILNTEGAQGLTHIPVNDLIAPMNNLFARDKGDVQTFVEKVVRTYCSK